ncbi:MAG: hypothetical protein LQ347_002494 [Umbilicaria vellea]|nr:MAG: hypothetical protein LQ347_002494 [Umbilicaria vellea]
MSLRPSVDTERTQVVTPQVSQYNMAAGSRTELPPNGETFIYDDADSLYDSRVIHTMENLQRGDTLPGESDDTLQIEEQRKLDQRRFDYLSRHINRTFMDDSSDVDVGDDRDRDVERDAVTSEKAAAQGSPPGIFAGPPGPPGPGGPRGPQDPNIVDWNGPDDPGNPMNWPRSKKWLVTFTFSLMTFVITFASSVFSTATVVTSKEYGVSTEVTTLGTSLFVLVSRRLAPILTDRPAR